MFKCREEMDLRDVVPVAHDSGPRTVTADITTTSAAVATSSASAVSSQVFKRRIRIGAQEESEQDHVKVHSLLYYIKTKY